MTARTQLTGTLLAWVLIAACGGPAATPTPVPLTSATPKPTIAPSPASPAATGTPADARVATTRLGNDTVTTVTGGGEAPTTIHVFVEGELAVVSAAPPDRVATLLDALR